MAKGPRRRYPKYRYNGRNTRSCMFCGARVSGSQATFLKHAVRYPAYRRINYTSQIVGLGTARYCWQPEAIVRAPAPQEEAS